MNQTVRAGLAALVFLSFVGGAMIARSFLDDSPDDTNTEADAVSVTDASPDASTSSIDKATTTTSPLSTTTSATVSTSSAAPEATTTTEAPAPVVQILSAEPPAPERAVEISQRLSSDIVLPSDCGIPLDVPASLPNSPRDYRNGTHQGIDFICLERGRSAVAALGGRVVVAVGDYVEPTPEDRGAVLQIAAEAGLTPPYILNMLYGNYVVIDHGVISGVGHVVSVYAHFDSLADGIVPGIAVEAGTRLGEIGNKGTDAASRGTERPQSIHLHWEIHVEGVHLGAGLGSADTRSVYVDLFADSL